MTKTTIEQREKMIEQRLTTLDAVECWYIIELLEKQTDTDNAALIKKLHVIAEAAVQKH